MSHDEKERDVVDKLRGLAPRVPEDARFWNDFTRDVRRAYDSRPRRRAWLWLAPLPVAALAALYLVVMPGRVAPPSAPPPEPSPRAPVTLPLPLPPPSDVEEVADDQLDEVLGELVEEDDLEDVVDIEDLTEEELRLVYEALKGA